MLDNLFKNKVQQKKKQPILICGSQEDLVNLLEHDIITVQIVSQLSCAASWILQFLAPCICCSLMFLGVFFFDIFPLAVFTKLPRKLLSPCHYGIMSARVFRRTVTHRQVSTHFPPHSRGR